MDERAFGRVEAQVENLIRTVKESNEAATTHREAIRQELAHINDKIGPINMSLTDLGRKVIAQGNILKTYEEQRIEFRGFTKAGKVLVHSLWITVSALFLFWGEHIKSPFIRFIELFK